MVAEYALLTLTKGRHGYPLCWLILNQHPNGMHSWDCFATVLFFLDYLV